MTHEAQPSSDSGMTLSKQGPSPIHSSGYADAGDANGQDSITSSTPDAEVISSRKGPTAPSPRFVQLLKRLSQLSVDDRTNIYRRFEWPETLPEHQYWMSPSLTSLYGTPAWEELTEAQRMRLSQRESIHFYSLNVQGEQDLLVDLIRRIHTPEYAPFSSYLHHFIGEENEHMWYFANFCELYGGGMYPDRRMATRTFENPIEQSFVTFARIEIFEELVDFYNARMGEDKSLPPIVQAINAAHHRDESRHVAFGREMVANLHSILRKTRSRDALLELEQYLKRYMSAMLQSLYNPAVYRDAGLPQDSYALRRQLLSDPYRKQRHQEILKRTVTAFVNEGIFETEGVPV